MRLLRVAMLAMLATLVWTTTASAAVTHHWAGTKRPSMPAACAKAAPSGWTSAACTVRHWTVRDYGGSFSGTATLSGGRNPCLQCQSMSWIASIDTYLWNGSAWRSAQIRYHDGMPGYQGAPTNVQVSGWTRDWAWVWFQQQWHAVPTSHLVVVSSYTY